MKLGSVSVAVALAAKDCTSNISVALFSRRLCQSFTRSPSSTRWASSLEGVSACGETPSRRFRSREVRASMLMFIFCVAFMFVFSLGCYRLLSFWFRFSLFTACLVQLLTAFLLWPRFYVDFVVLQQIL